MLAGLTAGEIRKIKIFLFMKTTLFLDESVYHLTAVFAEVRINE